MISLTNSQIGELMGQFLLAGTGTLSFAILFACPRRSLPTCALVGAVGWFVYELCVMLGLDTAAASLLGTEASHAIIGTLMILTPGIAFTMGIRDFVQGDYLSGTIRMIDALLIAASIAIGTGLVLSLTSILTGVTVV